MSTHEKALESFREAISKATGKYKHHGTLFLEKNGWVELFPQEDCWSFTHSDYPGEVIHWAPGQEPR